MREFRVIIFSSKTPATIIRLAERIRQELPEVTGIAIVYEKRHGKPVGSRVAGIFGRFSQPHYWPYAFHKVGRAFSRPFLRVRDGILRLMHACPVQPNGRLLGTLEDLHGFAKKNGIELLINTESNADESLAFIQDFRADLGVVFGTRFISSKVFHIPRLGSINLFKHKTPDYRGGGPAGLWELLDGKKEIGVTVHQVTVERDGEMVLREATIPIDPYDRLESLALKADVVGNDLLLATISDKMNGTSEARVCTGESRIIRNPTEPELLAYRRQLDEKLAKFDGRRSRPSWNLALRTVVLAPFLTLRNWIYRARKSFPVVILYHHLITDRPHHLGLPTEEFARQIEYLRKHYHIASLPEAMKMLEEKRVPSPTVVLTFDDGYAENYVNLRAITEVYHIPVFLFVSTAHMTSQASFFHDVRKQQLDFPPLSWEQISKLCGAGFEFGSHTKTHFDCGSTNEASLRDEIVNSRAELEGHIGTPVEHFSFPWGMAANMSEPAKKLALETYGYSYDAAGGINIPGKSTRQILRRSNHPFNVWDLELLLQSALELSHPADMAPALLGAPHRG